MSTIHNTELFRELKDGAKIQQLKDSIPSQLAEKVVPVMEVNPKLLRRSTISRYQILTNATSSTIYSTPADKDFFITGASLAYIKDATSTSTLIALRITIEGLTQNLLSFPGITLTAATGSMAISFPDPIKCDRSANIVITSSTNVANILATANISGYLVDNATA